MFTVFGLLLFRGGKLVSFCMKQIVDDVFQIAVAPRNGVNCYLAGEVLFDAGMRRSSKKILKALEGKTVKVHALTHAHGDHQGSSHVVCEALGLPLWCSEGSKPFVESGNVNGMFPNPNKWYLRLTKRMIAGPGHPVAKVIREGDRVGDFVAVASPGHSPGHLSFFREADGVLIVGDAVLNMHVFTTFVGLRRPPKFLTVDMDSVVASIKKLAALEPKILCFGHGPVLRDVGKWERFVKRIVL